MSNLAEFPNVSGDTPAGSHALRPEGLTGASGPSPDPLFDAIDQIFDRIITDLEGMTIALRAWTNAARREIEEKRG